LTRDYTSFLRRGALRGARIGVDRRFFDHYDAYGFTGDDDTLPLAQQALKAMAELGATLVDTDTGDPFAYGNDEFTALLFEFKVQIAEYLAGLTHTRMRTLADLIDFNVAHCPEELVFYGQELFELSQATSGDLNDPDYLAARRFAFQSARTGIDSALAKDHLDAIVAPHLTNSTAPAVSGYPNLALPVGLTPFGGKPAGILMYGTFLSEPKLLAFAYDLEQELRARTPPQFLGTVSDPPPPLLGSVGHPVGTSSAPRPRSTHSCPAPRTPASVAASPRSVRPLPSFGSSEAKTWNWSRVNSA
jgi:amidase